MISTITLDTYKQQIGSGDAFNLSDSFNGRVGDEQVPLAVQFKERGLAQQFQDGLVPFLTGFVGSLDENNQVTADTGEAVSYVGTSDDIIGLGRVKLNLPGTMFPQEGYFYGFLGLQNADGKRVTTFNVWFHVYNGNPDMFVNKAPFRTELQKLLDAVQLLINGANGDLNTWKQKLTDLFTTLSAQGADTATLLTTLQAQIKQSNLFTQGQMDKLLGALSDFKMPGTTVADKINGEFEGRGVNVKWFGAIGDGTTDDTKAIKDAIAYCTDMAGEVDGEHSYYHGTVFFPKGKYYISDKLIVSNVTLTGVDKYSSIIVSDTETAVFSLKMHSTVKNLGFEDTITTNQSGLRTRMLTIENGGEGTSAYFGIRMEHLFFRGQERVRGLSGVLEGGNWVLDAIYLDLNNVGVWDLTIDDISCNYVHSGLTIDTSNGGWLTGSYFNNMMVKGFTGWHTAIISNNNTARQVSQNIFSNLTADVVYQTAINGIGFIVSGVGNDWDNLKLFADGKYSGHAIQLRFFGSGSDPRMPSFGSGSSANNAFWGGTLEGDIDDPDNIRELQNFHNLRLQLTDENGNLQQVNVNNPTHVNLMASDTISKMLNVKSMFSLAKTASAVNGSDQYGKYLEITTGADTTNWELLFTEPEKVKETITAGDHSLGVKFQKMTKSSDIVGGFIILGGKPVLANDLVGQYGNPSIDGDLSVNSWVYRRDTDYLASLPTDNYVMDRLAFKIAANSKVRLYDAYLSGGRVIDFSRVTQNNNNNAQVDNGGRNYIQLGNSNWLQSGGLVVNQAVKAQGLTIATNDIQWLRGKNVVISVDTSITGYDATNVTGRQAATLSLNVTFEDGSTVSASAGPTNNSRSPIFDRYSVYFKLPNKVITSAQAVLSTPSGFTATSYRIGNAMLESGTIAHDYISYTGSRDSL